MKWHPVTAKFVPNLLVTYSVVDGNACTEKAGKGPQGSISLASAHIEVQGGGVLDLGVGTVRIYGTNNNQLEWTNLRDPSKVRDKLEEISKQLRAGREPQDDVDPPPDDIARDRDRDRDSDSAEKEVGSIGPERPQIHPQALTGHVGPIKVVVWDPRDRWVATAGWDGVVRLWDPRTGTPVLHLHGDVGEITSVAVAPDGSWLATAGGKLRVWNTATGMPRHSLDGPFKSAMAVHPGGEWLAVIATDNSVHLVNPRTGGLVKRLKPVGIGYSRVIDCLGFGYSLVIDCLAVDKSGHWLAIAGDENLTLWDTRTSRRRLRRGLLSRPFVSVGNARNLLIDPEARYLIHTNEHQEIQVTSVDDRSVIKIPLGCGWNAIAISPTGRWLAAQLRGEDCALCILDIASGQVLQRTQSKQGLGSIRRLLFARDETWLAATWNGGREFHVEIVDPATGARNNRVGARQTWINATAASPDSSALASVDDLGELQVSEIHSGKLRFCQSPDTHRAATLTVSPDGERLIIGAADGYVRAWDLNHQRQSFHFKAHEVHNQQGVTSLISSAHGRWFASAGRDGQVHFWDSNTGERLRSLAKRNEWRLEALAELSDDGWVATADNQGQVQLWDASTGEHLQDWGDGEPLSALAVGPSGTWLATAGLHPRGKYCFVRMMDPATGQTLGGVPTDPEWTRALKVIDDGRLIAAAGDDGLVYLIDLGDDPLKKPNPTVVERMSGHESGVIELAADPHGRWIASAGRDGVRLWDVRQRKCLHKLPLDDPWTTALAVDPQGDYLFSAGNDRLVRRWILGDLSQPPVCDFAFEPLPDGEWVAWRDPDGPNRCWENFSAGANKWLGWHAPSEGGGWCHQPTDTYPCPESSGTESSS